MYLLFTICNLSGKMYGNVHMSFLGVNSAKLCIKFASQLRMFAAYFAKKINLYVKWSNYTNYMCGL